VPYSPYSLYANTPYSLYSLYTNTPYSPYSPYSLYANTPYSLYTMREQKLERKLGLELSRLNEGPGQGRMDLFSATLPGAVYNLSISTQPTNQSTRIVSYSSPQYTTYQSINLHYQSIYTHTHHLNISYTPPPPHHIYLLALPASTTLAAVRYGDAATSAGYEDAVAAVAAGGMDYLIHHTLSHTSHTVHYARTLYTMLIHCILYTVLIHHPR
jgi:hypothetical protein